VGDLRPEAALAHIALSLRRLGKRFALVGGLAVSVRAEVRFTRDVDLAIGVADDAEMEAVVHDLRGVGYAPVAVVEQTERGRLATVRLESPGGMIVDLLAASSGIEHEIVERATSIAFEDTGDVPVARAEELLAMKVLSMTDERLQDHIDAVNLVLEGDGLDLDAVRANLALIEARGFHRGQDLARKLDAVLDAVKRPRGA
jgi:predicted nucleotidyltransferase